jgi:hypothetical protein
MLPAFLILQIVCFVPTAIAGNWIFIYLVWRTPTRETPWWYNSESDYHLWPVTLELLWGAPKVWHVSPIHRLLAPIWIPQANLYYLSNKHHKSHFVFKYLLLPRGFWTSPKCTASFRLSPHDPLCAICVIMTWATRWRHAQLLLDQKQKHWGF